MSARRVFGLTVLAVTVAGCTQNVTSISPTTVTAGTSAFDMTVLGSGFSSGDAVQLNGSNRSTTYVSATELIAQINAADVASAGSASITVTNPSAAALGTTSTSGTSSSGSNTETLSIVAPTGDANAYQIDPAHDGAATLASGTVTFPPPSSWHVNIGSGAPSNVVIADSMIFLTTGTSGGSQLLALSQANGGTAWGPIAISGTAGGSAGVAYDSDQVFVTQDQAGIGGGGTLYAYNASTGALNWSASLGAASPGAPTVADGYVYVIVGGSATLIALNETSGAIAWEQSLTGSSGTPAVTADGVYVAATTSGCFTIDFRPATGEVIWDTSNGTLYCPQGATTAVANGLAYSPNTSALAIFDAETGDNSTGTLAYSLPAAFNGTTGYFLQGSKLVALSLTAEATSDTVQWTFDGDNALNTPPIVVNDQYVIVGSTAGNLYAVDTTSGTSAWTQSLGNNIVQLSVGDGLLVAVTETGNNNSGTLTAYTIAASP
ncbi:MAG TPA: PQQ-binding-like beta-propeller repeat protein [Steroidobacteraceae bacterium]|nr:PQQ-binding-like beta-propeller repeat protein [Steroidobacteraceae bacterium]